MHTDISHTRYVPEGELNPQDKQILADPKPSCLAKRREHRERWERVGVDLGPRPGPELDVSRSACARHPLGVFRASTGTDWPACLPPLSPAGQ